MYQWFFLLEITVVDILHNLNVCSAHSYLYPRSRFNRASLSISSCRKEKFEDTKGVIRRKNKNKKQKQNKKPKTIYIVYNKKSEKSYSISLPWLRNSSQK
jgi:hypothetical protein